MVKLSRLIAPAGKLEKKITTNITKRLQLRYRLEMQHYLPNDFLCFFFERVFLITYDRINTSVTFLDLQKK